MKVGLLTFHDTTNFGSLLQTYGLYKKIVDLGYKCEVIDYQCPNIVKREIPAPFKLTLNPRQILKEFFFNSKIRYKYKSLYSFLHKNMVVGPRCDRSNIREIASEYDKIVVGSDILWSLDITGNDLTYFLDFVPDSKKKMTFATSIGNPWTNEQKSFVAPYLKEINLITVREDESAEWVREITGICPEVVCDPTMLLTSDDWKTLAGTVAHRSDYVLVYFDNKTGDCIKAAKKYAAHNGLKVKYINYGIPIKGVSNIRPTSLEEFLSYILFADKVVTASYHGLLFSIYFNKQFVYYNRAHKSRMNTVSKYLNVSKYNGEECDIINVKPLDYTIVNQEIDNFRHKSMSILKKYLES